MSNYRDDFRATSREYYWTLPRVAVGLVVGIAVIGGAFAAMFVLSQPGRVVSKTLNADKMIANYEFFHDANNQVKARVAQIAAHKDIATTNTDTQEANRLRVEVASMQQSCRDLVAKYNANAGKANRNLFMGRDVPENLKLDMCK
jgi:hypothetical protein